MSFLYQLLLLTLATLTIITATSTIDFDKHHLYQIHGDEKSAVQLVVEVDLLCPYSADTYSTLTKVFTDYSNSDLAVNLLIFTLPYHRNSWMTAVAAEIVHHNNRTQPARHHYVSSVFERQDNFGVAVTQTEVIRHLARIAAEAYTFNTNDVAESLNVIRSGLVNDKYEMHTRGNFRYIVEEVGVASTPNYWVNGVFRNDIDSDWSVKQWKSLIDSKLSNSSTGRAQKQTLVDDEDFGDDIYMDGSFVDSSADSSYGLAIPMLLLAMLSVGCYAAYTRYADRKQYDIIADHSSWPVARAARV